MRTFLLVCCLASSAAAQDHPVWFVDPPEWRQMAHAETTDSPEIVLLADAGCPESWPAATPAVEGGTIEAGSSVMYADLQWCDANLLARSERDLSGLLDTLYDSVSPEAMETRGVDSYRYEITEPQRALVAAHLAWLAHRDAACEFEGALTFGWMGGAHVVIRCLASRTREWADFIRSQHQAAANPGDY